MDTFTFIKYFGLACIAIITILVIHSLFKQAKKFYRGELPLTDPLTAARQRNWYRIYGVALVIVGVLQVIANLGTGLQASSFTIGQVFIGVALVIFSFNKRQEASTGTNSSKGIRVLTIISMILFIAAYVFVFNFGGLSGLLSH